MLTYIPVLDFDIAAIDEQNPGPEPSKIVKIMYTTLRRELKLTNFAMHEYYNVMWLDYDSIAYERLILHVGLHSESSFFM